MNALELKLGLLEEIHALVGVGDIHWHRDNARLSTQFFRGSVQILSAAGNEDEVGTGRGETARGRRADAGGPARNDDRFIFEVLVHRQSLATALLQQKLWREQDQKRK